jgi:hypothetical protein
MEWLSTGRRSEKGWKLKAKRGAEGSSLLGGAFDRPPHYLSNLNIPYNTYMIVRMTYHIPI